MKFGFDFTHLRGAFSLHSPMSCGHSKAPLVRTLKADDCSSTYKNGTGAILSLNHSIHDNEVPKRMVDEGQDSRTGSND